jgi:ATP-dependent protease Clp ATPase subunit
MLVRIMSVPKNSIYRQYIEIFRGEGVELSIGPRSSSRSPKSPSSTRPARAACVASSRN